MLQIPQESPYDLRFRFLNFAVRVSWTFWAFSAIFGYSFARSLDWAYASRNWDTPGVGPLLLIWIAASFLTILIHELGHTLAFRYFGIDSQIVLYHMGGLAIPTGTILGRPRKRVDQFSQIAISAAGPLLQLAFGIAAAVLAVRFGYSPGSTAEYFAGLINIELPVELVSPDNAALTAVIESFVFVSLAWSLLNLVPILPLDGGQIARDVAGILNRTNGQLEATYLSIAAAAVMAIWMFQIERTFAAFMFAFLGISNFQNLQNFRSSGW